MAVVKKNLNGELVKVHDETGKLLVTAGLFCDENGYRKYPLRWRDCECL